MERRKSKIILLTIFTFIGSYITTFIILPFSTLKSYYSSMPFPRFAADLLLNFLFCISIVTLCLFIDKVLNKRIPWMTHPWKRLTLQIFLQIFSALLLIISLGLIYLTFSNPEDVQSSLISFRQGMLSLISVLLWALMISALNTGTFLLNNWKITTVNAMEYKLKAAQNKQLASEIELQSLKLQLDPHFVFNNLSVLSELILKDQQLGYDYTENFAKVYRYLLINSKRELITLAEEIKFLNAYLFLMSHRIGAEGISFQIDIDESKLNLMIPPLTLQLLIENALKYNRAEENNPLSIRVFLNGKNELEVSNRMLPKTGIIESTGVGLNNIMNRYALLGDKRPIIEKNEELFTVKIPLLHD